MLALLIRRPGGLVVEMPDGAPHGCSAVALTPGWMRSEMKLEHYQVTVATWRDAAGANPHFKAISESPPADATGYR